MTVRECARDVGGQCIHGTCENVQMRGSPILFWRLQLSAPLPARRRRTGQHRRGRERPPGFDASCGIAEGWHVHTHATLRRGSLPSNYPCRKATERRSGHGRSLDRIGLRPPLSSAKWSAHASTNCRPGLSSLPTAGSLSNPLLLSRRLEPFSLLVVALQEAALDEP